MKFNLEGKYFLMLKKVGDLVLLQLAFLITCIPIVTIGAGITALYSVSRKLRKDSVSFVFQTYFSDFKTNLKKSTAVWLLLLAAVVLLFIDYSFYTTLASSFAWVVALAVFILAFLICAVFIYIFPLIAWFENDLKSHLKNALILSIGHLGTTLLAMLILGGFALLAILALQIFAFFGFSVSAYWLSILLSRVLIPEDGNELEKEK